eukprot:SAG31_NODE_4574_length_3124_cov_3.152397_3_plen_304_part_00
MALPSADGQSWRLQILEDLAQLWKTKRRQVQEVFADSGRNGNGIFTPSELHAVLKKLGLVLSTAKAHELHSVIDKNQSGGVSMDDVIAWVHGAPHDGNMQSFRDAIVRLVQLHLGSAENAFLYIQKKVGVNGLRLTAAQFEAGLRCLLNWDRDAEHWRAEDLPLHFSKAGGRDDLLSYQNFLKYFNPPGAPTFEKGPLPRSVEFLASNKLEISNRLSKESGGASFVSLATFRNVLAKGFGGGPVTKLVLNVEDWEHLVSIADPLGEGRVVYKPFLNRCRLRLDSIKNCNFRRTGRIARATNRA